MREVDDGNILKSIYSEVIRKVGITPSGLINRLERYIQSTSNIKISEKRIVTQTRNMTTALRGDSVTWKYLLKIFRALWVTRITITMKLDFEEEDSVVVTKVIHLDEKPKEQEYIKP